ncbi:MAG: FtsH protease activity modulator HflK [Pseudomonadota bacterium]|nr:FtsH protease activity modulator HflK [Pseudomonadota bacterium]
MPWSDNSGKGGPTRGPWGQQPPRPPGGNNNGNGGGRSEPPDLEELLKASRQRLKRAFPRGGGNGGGGGPGAPRLSRNSLALAGAAVVGLWVVSGFYQVDADELAVVTTFGKYSAITSPGLHWHVPMPVQNARREKVTSLRYTNIPEGTGRRGEAGGLMLTGDKNIVDVAMQVQWRIKTDTVAEQGDALPPVAQFMFNINDAPNVVRTVGEASIREVVGRNELDFVQTEGRTEVQEQTRALMQEALDLYKTGIEIAEVNLEKADPPTDEVNAAFLDVIAASQDRNTIINGARAYANRVVPEARGQAQRILEGARAYQAQVTADARGQAARFDSILAEYQRAPQVTRQRMYLETVEQVLGPMNKIIVEDKAGGGVVPYLPLNELQKKPQQQPTGSK